MNIRFLFLVLTSSFLIGTQSFAAENDLRQALFTNADSAYQRAMQVNANMLAPESFSTALEQYRDAETQLKRGGDIEAIKDSLNKAVKNFAKATSATKVASVTLSDAWTARDDAMSAGSQTHATKTWNKAEQRFVKAAEWLEDGRLKSAERESETAQKMYRDAELEAIQANLLSETRKTIAWVENSRYRRDIPITLNKAKELLKQTENTLQENRYDTDTARILARRANHE
ncbi:MAG: hypothetical protein HKM24_04555, partial [Gammaproteobacteria bacterium]|nr:hypothetical protein [Gammaproteobacteria bacterium]